MSIQYTAFGLSLFGIGFAAGIIFAKWCTMRDKAQEAQREAYWRRQQQRQRLNQGHERNWLND